MIHDYPISKKENWKLIASESLAAVAVLALFPFGYIRKKIRTPRAAKIRTVVFVHGYLSNGSAFAPLRAYLLTKGIGKVLHFNYKPGNSVERSAIELQKFLKKNVRGGRIDLVCHSLGGVIANFYLQEIDGARRVDRCITLGSPLLGTYNAYWIPSKVGNDLRPDSTLIKRLIESRDNAKKVQFTSIVAGADNIVIPRIFAAGAAHVEHIPNVGHLGLLFSPKVFKIVFNCLDNV